MVIRHFIRSKNTFCDHSLSLISDFVGSTHSKVSGNAKSTQKYNHIKDESLA